jgi:MATE family multidrug resistance protein
MFANATGFAVGSGLAMALDTLCSQAYGAKKYHLVGLHCQRAMTILTIACIPIALLWWNSEFALKLIATDDTPALSLFWIRRLVPSLWPRLMYEAYRRYLLSQRVMWPMTVSVAIIVPFHILNTYLFVFKLELGYSGAAWATSISYWLLFLTLVGVSSIRLWYLRRRAAGRQFSKIFDESESSEAESNDDLETKDGADELQVEAFEGDELHTWPPLSKDIFRGWLGFLKLGVATTASLVIEWGSFEVNAAIASRLGEIPLAAHAIMCNSVSVWYCIPLGVATATTTLVGNMLGAGDADKAKLYTRIAFVLALIYGILNGGLGMIYRDLLGLAFTDDEAVVAMISSMMGVMWIYGLVDAIKAIGMAVLRGSGRPVLTVYGNVLSCLVVGYPVALLLVLKFKMGMPGLWLGMSSAWLCASAIYVTIIAKTDWRAEVGKAMQRNADALASTQRGAALAREGLLLRAVVSVDKDEDGKFSIDGEDEKTEEGGVLLKGGPEE